MTGTPASGFSAVDDATDPAFLIGYLDRLAAELAHVKGRLLARLDLAAGQVVLDVGCGTGDDVRAMAGLVGASGRAIGLDASRTMVDEARRRSAGGELPVELRVGDAHHLPFPTATVHACRAERVLQHLPDPAGAVAEMARVTRPGDRVVVLEPDWETMVIDHPDHALTRRILDARSASLASPRVGRQLPRLLSCAGLTGITAMPLTVISVGAPGAAGGMLELLRLPQTVEQAVADRLITAAQADRWLTGVAGLARSGSLFAAMTCFLVAGTRPG
jgi:SAM-dependent methyltransferase